MGEQFKYNSKDERYARMNKFYVFVTSGIWALFAFFLLIKLANNAMNMTVGAGCMIAILFFFAANIAIYRKNRASGPLKNIVVLEVIITTLTLGLSTDASFIYYALVGSMALMIPYYELKNFRTLSIMASVTAFGIMVFRALTNMVALDGDFACEFIFVETLIFVCYRLGSIVRVYSDHALGYAEQQANKQKEMLDGIVDISKTVQEESGRSDELVNELVGISEQVSLSMKEISAATNITAESIEDQNSMTQNIQAAIGETGECSKKAVAIATESNASVQENLKIIEELKVQSAKVASINHEVNAAMIKLQDKTKEVGNIADMILRISSQTNLLALNASIESARAGEAGRGFAVVADQIRDLAEQTKKSTEQIGQIVKELTENANSVVNAVDNSMQETDSQNTKIYAAAESFVKLNQDITELIQDILVIDEQITGLSESNNRIVENISQLSATTQEITASAEQVAEMSERNLEHAEGVQASIGLIKGKSDGLKAYL